MNMRELIRKVTEIEGKKQQISIAQVGEVVKITLHLLGKDYRSSDVLDTVEKYAERSV